MTQLQAIIISLQKIPPAPPNLLPRPYYHMTTNDPCSISVQRSQYNIMQSTQALGDIDHELQPNGHLPGINSASLYPAMNNINAPPPTRYYDDPPHLARCPGEQQGNQCQHQPDGHRPPETTQYAPMIHAVPPNYVPFPHNIPGPSREHPSPVVQSITSVDEDLKRIASHYLRNPDSRVDKLRAKRSRSGTVKVLILLEIDDAI